MPIVTQSSVIRYTASLFVYIRNIKNKSRRRKKDARVYISKAAGSAADVATETVGRAFGFEIRPSTTSQRWLTYISLTFASSLTDYKTRAASTAQIMIASQSLFFYLYFVVVLYPAGDSFLLCNNNTKKKEIDNVGFCCCDPFASE